jgi:hypothetical protein
MGRAPDIGAQRRCAGRRMGTSIIATQHTVVRIHGKAGERGNARPGKEVSCGRNLTSGFLNTPIQVRFQPPDCHPLLRNAPASVRAELDLEGARLARPNRNRPRSCGEDASTKSPIPCDP